MCASTTQKSCDKCIKISTQFDKNDYSVVDSFQWALVGIQLHHFLKIFLQYIFI